MYEVVIVKSALRQLKKIEPRIQLKLIARINALAENPRPAGVEKLSNRENEYRIRLADYRIIYSIFDKQLIVEIIEVGNRREIYR